MELVEGVRRRTAHMTWAAEALRLKRGLQLNIFADRILEIGSIGGASRGASSDPSSSPWSMYGEYAHDVGG